MIGLAQWLPALLVCAALAAIAWRLRAQAPPPGEVGFETLASTPLGPGQRLLAVRAADRVYLLAVTQQGVSRVGVMAAVRWSSDRGREAVQPLAMARGAGD